MKLFSWNVLLAERLCWWSAINLLIRARFLLLTRRLNWCSDLHIAHIIPRSPAMTLKKRFQWLITARTTQQINPANVRRCEPIRKTKSYLSFIVALIATDSLYHRSMIKLFLSTRHSGRRNSSLVTRPTQGAYKQRIASMLMSSI